MALIVYFLVSAFGVSATTDNCYVTKINPSNHNDVFDSNNLVVKFCNSNLRSCQELQALFQKSAFEAATSNLPVKFAEVDCKDQAELCLKHSVSGQPVIKLYNRGKVEMTYHNLNSLQWTLYEHIKNLTSSRLIFLKTSKDLETFLQSDFFSVIGFLSGQCELMNVFKRLSDEFRSQFQFALSESTDLNAEAGYSHDIVLFRPKYLHNNYEDDQVKYDGKSKDEELRSFLTGKLFGLVGVRTKSNQRFFTERPLFVGYFDFDFKDNAIESRYWRNRILKVAQQYQNRAQFAISNQAIFDQEVEEFGLSKNGIRLVSGEAEPMFAAFSHNKRYRMDDQFCVENLTNFVENVLAGSMQNFIKSEDEVNTNDDFVKVVVAKNFEKVILNSTSNVFIMLFSSACGLCRKLSITLDELDIPFLNNDDIIFAKMDIFANDVPQIFPIVHEDKPNLYWLSKNDKKTPVMYDESYERKDILKFVQNKLEKRSDDTVLNTDTDTSHFHNEL